MTEFSFSEPLDELEALLRSAKDYVHPSDDLRPRVLEAARSQRQQRRLLSYLQHAAVALVVLGALASAIYGTSDFAKVASASRERMLTSATQDGNWGLVDSLTKLRRRQAVLLGSAGELPHPNS